MKGIERPKTTRMSAKERREEILEAAMAEFAVHGLHGTSTETIAQRVGVSQPYIFRLFGTKKDLFLAAIERGFDHVEDAFRRAAEDNPTEPLQAMARTYFRFLSRREELLLQMQAYAAAADPDVQRVVRRRYGDLYRFVQEVSGASDAEVREFFAHGMLLNVAAELDLLSMLDQEWVRSCLGVGR